MIARTVFRIIHKNKENWEKTLFLEPIKLTYATELLIQNPVAKICVKNRKKNREHAAEVNSVFPFFLNNRENPKQIIQQTQFQKSSGLPSISSASSWT